MEPAVLFFHSEFNALGGDVTYRLWAYRDVSALRNAVVATTLARQRAHRRNFRVRVANLRARRWRRWPLGIPRLQFVGCPLRVLTGIVSQHGIRDPRY